MSIKEALNWRYATKKMNGEKVPQEKVDQIVTAANLAPTSYGIQPFRVIVVSNDELKEKIKAVAYGQEQITDCSHLLIFAAWDNYTEERVRGMLSYTNAQRGLPESANADYFNTIVTNLVSKSPEESFVHTSKQAYLAFGVALTEAATLKVDATPMEGFDAAKLDELLDLKSLGLKSTTLLPLGHRDEEGDWLLKLKKVRTPMEDFVIEHK